MYAKLKDLPDQAPRSHLPLVQLQHSASADVEFSSSTGREQRVVVGPGTCQMLVGASRSSSTFGWGRCFGNDQINRSTCVTMTTIGIAVD